jgi:prefoldin subunit 5
MNEQIEKRLRTLEEEYQSGRRMLAELEAKEAALKSSLLRISGAIQVLREFVPAEAQEPAPTQAAQGDGATAYAA